MRIASKLLAGCAALVLTALTLMAPAMGQARADPPGGTTPRPSDVVGVGSDTIGYLLDQLSRDYDKSQPKGASLLYSWDAANPASGKTGDPIVTKKGCKAVPRPGGSLAAISALHAGLLDPAGHHVHCVDFAGSSSAPASASRPCSVEHICYLPLATDAVTWASRSAASGGTDAPARLTISQLKGIYSCKITNWATVGGRHGRIRPFLPQTSSGTRTFWLSALRLKAPGACVSDEGNTPPDNQGINPALDGAQVIVPYSVADFLTQVYRDARCTHSSCTGSPACTPTAAQNLFGCDEHGVLRLDEISGSPPPTLPWPLPKSKCKPCTINPKFTPVLQRFVYVAVRRAGTADQIPAYLEPIFGAGSGKTLGWVCSKPQAKTDIVAYGFLPLNAPPAPGDVPNAQPRCGTPYH
jgi:ABC-type phosphate transport system substrate-binding protein